MDQEAFLVVLKEELEARLQPLIEMHRAQMQASRDSRLEQRCPERLNRAPRGLIALHSFGSLGEPLVDVVTVDQPHPGPDEEFPSHSSTRFHSSGAPSWTTTVGSLGRCPNR
ncbi:MAG TPA: hypothetical protein VFT22_16820 [Kofleriaceae bacterium]|nr:hypothetical protein [Kofleriaceae bacterium]